MRNAFEILGATPFDNGEKLRELFDDKQLLLDDDKELSEAYAILTNPKKRIRQEIEYFAKDVLEQFDKIFLDNDDEEQKMSVVSTCNAIVELGKWFDESADYIIDEINDNREISGFAIIKDNGIVGATITEFKSDCTSAVTKYFNYLTESGIVSIFNALVKVDDFQSFFVDDLLSHYEIKIAVPLKIWKSECISKFAEIEKLCNSFNNGNSLPSELDGKVTEFKKTITAWDKLAQPLQVNAQLRGAEHDGSAVFVHDIRNKVIDLCNRSQESLNKLVANLQFSDSAKRELPQKLADSVKFTDIIIKLLDILRDTFEEIEQTAEQLEKDKEDISQLKITLSGLLSKVDPYGLKKRNSNSSSQNSRSGGYSGSGASGSSSSAKKWGWGIFAVVILIIIVASIISGIPKDGKTYTVTLDAGEGRIWEYENGYNTGKQTRTVTVTYGSPMPSATIPLRIGYDFKGYFTSTNGIGAQYYDASMNSVIDWDSGSVDKLHAHWTITNNVTLTKDNFSYYFTLSCSVTSGYSYVFNYTIQKKSNVIVDNLWSSDTISVTLYCKVGEGNTFTVTLNKANDYYLSGTKALTASQSSYYYSNPVGYVTECSGKVYAR